MLMGLRAKDIHMALKTDDPAGELMRKFEIPTETQLFDSIRKVVPQGYKEFIRQIEKKSKKCKKRPAAVPVEVSSNHTCTVENEDVLDVAIIGDSESVKAVMTFEPFDEFEEVEECEAMQSTENREKELEQLQLDERELSDMVCALEKEHIDIVSQRARILEKLEGSDKALKELRKALREEQQKATALCKEYDELENKMQDVTRECSAHKVLLENIRHRIAELNKINIFVYENGSIEVENGETVSVSEGSIASGFEILYKLPEADELMVKEVKAVVRLVYMVATYERQGKGYEIYFENPKVQKLWEAKKEYDFGYCTTE